MTTKPIEEALFQIQPATVKNYNLFVCLLFLPIVSKKWTLAKQEIEQWDDWNIRCEMFDENVTIKL